MAPRLNKRQQREQDELQALTGSGAVLPRSSSEEGDSRGSIPTRLATGFTSLTFSEPSSDEGDPRSAEVASKAKKTRKKKKKSLITDPEASHSIGQEANTNNAQITNQNSKKGKKVTKKDKGKGAANSATGEDDLDKVLAELSSKYPDLKRLQNAESSSEPNGRLNSPNSIRNSLLSVSLQDLDSEAEMRKFFGKKVINAAKSSEKPQRRVRVAAQTIKSNLTKPQPDWWSASNREGLTIRALTDEELSERARRSRQTSGGDKWWTVEYSKRYRSVTKAFVNAVLSGDPEQIWSIVGILPWHADTLLQLAEVYRHSEEHSQHADFLNRALFTYERAFMGAFSFTTGANRLDFDCVENRPFYLAIARITKDLQRRGTLRSAFEFSRLLLSLDPYSDPHGSLLCIDHLSLRANMWDWLLEMWESYDEEARKSTDQDFNHRFNTTALPGWAYSRALALRLKEDDEGSESHSSSDSALRTAILSFPAVVPLLGDKIDITLSSLVTSHPECRIHVDASSCANLTEAILQLLSHLYANRSMALWKLPQNSKWFKDTVESTFSQQKFSRHTLRQRFDKTFKTKPGSEPPLLRSICRHILVLDNNLTQRLLSFMPKSMSADIGMSCDPLPPLDGVSTYDSQFFTGTEDVFANRPRTRRQRENEERLLARMIPDQTLRAQLQIVYDNNPALRRRFPGGVVQFAQAAMQMPEDLFEDLLLVQQLGVAANEGLMPGGFEPPDDDRPEADAAAEPLQIIPPREAPLPHGEAHPEEIDDSQEEYSENEPPEGEAPALFPVRMLRNLVNRFWGGNTAQLNETEGQELGPNEDWVIENSDVD